MYLGSRRVQDLLSILFSTGQLLGTASSFRSISTTTRHSGQRASSRLFESLAAKSGIAPVSSSMTNQDPPALPPVAATAKRLFLVRHGEVINPGGDKIVFYGGMDVPLSDLGKQEAQAAASYLSRYDMSRVFSSPLSRAVYGANQVLQKQLEKRRPDEISAPPPDVVVVLDGFTELDRGAWGGLTKEEIGPDLLARFDACDESVTPPGGESYPALKRRVLAARDVALSQVPPGTAACLVSHLQVTRCILSDALGMPVEQMVDLKVATASVTCIDYEYDTNDDDAGSATATVRFQSYKPDVGLRASKDGAN